MKGRIAGDLASPIFNSCQAEKQPERKNAHRKTNAAAHDG